MTREGKLFYDATKHILASVEEIPRIAQDIQTGGRQFHLLTTPRIAQAVVSPALSRLRKDNARLHCRIDVLSRSDLENSLGSSRFDLAIATLPLPPSQAPVEAKALFKVRVEAVLPRKHPLAARDHLTAADLAHEDLIGPWHDPLWRQQMSDFLPSIPGRPVCTVETRSALMACQMASDGAGIAFLDRLSARGLDLGEVEFRPLSPDKWITFGYIHPRGKTLGSNARQFIDAIIETVSDFKNRSPSNGQSVELANFAN